MFARSTTRTPGRSGAGTRHRCRPRSDVRWIRPFVSESLQADSPGDADSGCGAAGDDGTVRCHTEHEGWHCHLVARVRGGSWNGKGRSLLRIGCCVPAGKRHVMGDASQEEGPAVAFSASQERSEGCALRAAG